MNPTAPNLDPKLKEAYDRVMGSSPSQPSATPAQQPQATAPVQHQTPPQTNNTPQPQSNPINTPTPIININSSGKTGNLSKGRKMPKAVWIVVGLGFFAAYTLIWFKVFNIKLF